MQIFNIHRIHINPEGETQRQLVGKYSLDNGLFNVLEDHEGVFDGAQSGGQVTPDLQATLDGFNSSSYYQTEDIDSMEYKLGEIPESTVTDLAHLHNDMLAKNPTQEFTLARDGKAYKLCYNHALGTFTINNSSATPEEIDSILEEVRSGRAALEGL